jgi:hypothetical protein
VLCCMSFVAKRLSGQPCAVLHVVCCETVVVQPCAVLHVVCCETVVVQPCAVLHVVSVDVALTTVGLILG